MAKSPFSREGETLLPVPLDPKQGGRAPMTSKGFEVDMNVPADKTRAMFKNAFEHPDAYDRLGDDFERQYGIDHPVTQSPAVEMPKLGHDARLRERGFMLLSSDKDGKTVQAMTQQLIGGKVETTPIVEMWCPKCNAKSPGDWSQCMGTCPISFSPYFNK